jgi:hypothetical protein
MIALTIILIVLGAVLIVIPAAGVPQVAPLAPLGWLLAVIGIILLVVVLVLVGSEEVDVHSAVGWIGGGAAFTMAAIPPVHFHGAGEDEASRPVAGSLTDRQPVIVAFVVGAIPLIAAALTGLASIFTGMPEWIVPTFTIVGTLTTGLAALWARQQVTPVALPRLDDETPLVPMVEREGV